MSLKRRLERATRRARIDAFPDRVIDLLCYPPVYSDEPFTTIVRTKWEGGRCETGYVAPDEKHLRQWRQWRDETQRRRPEIYEALKRARAR